MWPAGTLAGFMVLAVFSSSLLAFSPHIGNKIGNACILIELPKIIQVDFPK